MTLMLTEDFQDPGLVEGVRFVNPQEARASTQKLKQQMTTGAELKP